MKKVNIKISVIREYSIEFDENVVNQELIDNYNQYFSNISQEPDSLKAWDETDSENYPYMNLAETIAYQQALYDNLDIEGLPEVALKSTLKKDTAPIIVNCEDSDEEYECDINECDFN